MDLKTAMSAGRLFQRMGARWEEALQPADLCLNLGTDSLLTRVSNEIGKRGLVE